MVVTFCGHKEIADYEAVRQWLADILYGLIADGARTFLLGGYGEFDSLAALLLRDLKQRYDAIEVILVLPYLNRNMDSSEYDSTIYPPLERVPKRFAISRRNQWMVEQADLVVAYVQHSWGGAAKTLEYAERKKKAVLRYGTAFSYPCEKR